MKFSDDRIADIAHHIQTALSKSGKVAWEDPDKVLRSIKKTMIEYLKIEDSADEAARAKIATLKRGVTEGSREWDILYQKYRDEEMSKKGR